MQHTTPLGGIDIILGSMQSGKSTELLRRLTIYLESGLNVLYVNSSQDTRDSRSFSTHNPLLSSVETIKTERNVMNTRKVSKLFEVTDYKKFDVIGIDEAQFFPDLVDFATICADQFNTRVIVSGLDGDFQRKKFGSMLSLIPHCDSVIKLTSLCRKCLESGVMSDGIFNHRTTDSKDKVLIGGADKYMPLCRRCYTS